MVVYQLDVWFVNKDTLQITIKFLNLQKVRENILRRVTTFVRPETMYPELKSGSLLVMDQPLSPLKKLEKPETKGVDIWSIIVVVMVTTLLVILVSILF